MAKKENVNLNEIDANFVISSFKNKERRNNPSSIPKALVPEHEKETQEVQPEETETPAAVQAEAPREEPKRKRSKAWKTR